MIPRPIIKVRLSGDGLRRAYRILQANFRIAMGVTGFFISEKIKASAREWTGEGRRSIKFYVSNRPTGYAVYITSSLIQVVIDELGLPRGIFPPFRPGTKIYKYASAKLNRNYKDPITRTTRTRSVRHLSHLSRSPFRETRRKRYVRPKGKRVSSARRSDTAAKKRAAFLFARAIFEHGIKANYIFTKQLNNLRIKAVEEMKTAITRAISQMRIN